MISLSVTQARSKLYRILDEAAESHEPIQITGKRSNAALVSEADWRSIQETLHLVSISGMRDSNPQGPRGTARKIRHQSRLVSWTIVYTKQAQTDARKLASSSLRPQAQRLLDVIAENPFQNPPPYEKSVGDLLGACSRRINIQHRLVYQVYDAEHTVKVIRMWTHYE